MKEAVIKFNEVTNELKDLVLKEGFNEETLMGLDENTLKAVQLCFKLMEASQQIMIKQAELMDNQDKKLDMILEQIKKG